MAYKVLVIEDHEIVRENIAELLSLSNYSVVTASDGEIGIEMAKKHLPDIIICDIMMPKFDGYEVLKKLSENSSTFAIPFIFLSAKTEKMDIRKGMELGADDYLTKPFKEEELINAIESRLAKVAILRENSTTGEIRKNEFGIKNLNELKNYIIDFSEELTFKSGDDIYLEDGNAYFVYLIYKGVVKTYRIDEQGKELITAVFKDDDLFGFTSFLENKSFEETATAIIDTTLYRFSKTDFKTLIEENTIVSLELIDYINNNLAEAKGQLLQMAYSSVRKKTASSILKFTKRVQKSDDNFIRISRNDLASVAGITKESFVRTLSEFKKSGIIETEGRNIKIIDIKKLKNID